MKEERRSRSWLYEMPLFFLALLALQRGIFPDDPCFRSFNPNPFWLALLVFGLRYGLAAGTVSGLAAAALHCLGARLAGQSYLLGDAEFYAAPGLYLVAGAALGGVADLFAHRLAGLRTTIRELEARVRGQQDHLLAQQKAMRAIEQQVVSQMSSVVTLYHGSRELGTLDRAALFPAILDFFTQALRAEKTTLYIPTPHRRWRLLGQSGWSEAQPPSAELTAERGVVALAAQSRKPATVRDLAKTPEDAGDEPLMAAPLLEPGGEVAAVFAVHAMPLLRFNTASVNLLGLLAEWGSESLERCIRVDELKARSLVDEELGVCTGSYLQARAEQESSRSRRDGSPFSLLLVQVASADLPPERRPALLRSLARLLRQASREADVVGRSVYDGADLAVVLVGTARPQAEAALGRMEAAWRELGLPAEVRFGLGSWSRDRSSLGEVIDQARNALA